MKTFWRRISVELCCAPMTPALITAAVSLILGSLVAVSGKGYGAFLPRTLFSVIYMGIFWGIFYAGIGFALGCFLFSENYHDHIHGEQTALLFLCTLVLSYAWTAVVCKAGNCFLGLLICFSIVTCLITLFSALRARCLLPGIIVLSGCLWMIYVIYYTFSLMFFHL